MHLKEEFPIEIKKWILINGVENEETQTIYITLPPGIDENEMVIMRNQGHQLSENVKGDIKVNIKIKVYIVFVCCEVIRSSIYIELIIPWYACSIANPLGSL